MVLIIMFTLHEKKQIRSMSHWEKLYKTFYKKNYTKQKRYVQVSHRDPSNATHFNTGVLTRIARVILVKTPVLKCVALLGSQWLSVSFPLRKLYFHFLSHWMGYDRGDSFSFDFKPNGIPFGSENRKENCHHASLPENCEPDRCGSLINWIKTNTKS